MKPLKVWQGCAEQAVIYKASGLAEIETSVEMFKARKLAKTKPINIHQPRQGGKHQREQPKERIDKRSWQSHWPTLPIEAAVYDKMSSLLGDSPPAISLTTVVP
jgi:hypothetical protein